MDQAAPMDANASRTDRTAHFEEVRPAKRVRHYHQLPGNVLSQSDKRRIAEREHAYNDGERLFTLADLKQLELPMRDILPRVTVDGVELLKECAEVVEQLLDKEAEFANIQREISAIRSSFTDVPNPSAEQLQRALFIVNLERSLEKFSPDALVPRSIRRKLKDDA